MQYIIFAVVRVVQTDPVDYWVIFTQRSGTLTTQMHHNSQKRINTSELYQDLRDLALTLQSQKHPSPSL